MGQPTSEQINLMLRFYELRREPRLRQAREWFVRNFNATTLEAAMKNYPFGSEGNTFMRMTLSYWDMAANLVNRGLMDEELFFETTGEQWLVWERIKPLVPAWRAAFKNPNVFSNLEEHCKRLDAWREKRAPGSTEAMRQVMQQMAAGQAQAKTAAD
jgi:hypothetical protein